MEPVHATMEPVHTTTEPVHATTEPVHARVERNITTLIRKYTVTDPNFFKAKHYKKVLHNLKTITVTCKEDAAKVAPGAGIRKTIEDIVVSGEDHPDVKEFDSMTCQHESMEALSQIHGIGPAKARELVLTHGVKTIDDLRSGDPTNEVQKKGLLNEVQKKGLRYHEDIQKRIPRKEMIKHDTFLSKVLASARIVVMGSYRRGAKTSGDIDVLLGGDRNCLREFVELLVEAGYVERGEEFAFGEVKYMGVCKLPRHKTWRRLDILYAPPNEHSFAMLYFTGSKELNTKMRAHALSKGLTLNEKGIFEGDRRVDHPFGTEKDIFDYLEMPYLEPEAR